MIKFEFYLVKHGFQIDYVLDGKILESHCRDYGDNYPIKDQEQFLFDEFRKMMHKLKERFP